jgi:hypothetical protein
MDEEVLALDTLYHSIETKDFFSMFAYAVFIVKNF